MKDVKYYDSLPWEVQIERDVRAKCSPREHARHGCLARSASRYSVPPACRLDALGFRCVVVPPGSPPK